MWGCHNEDEHREEGREEAGVTPRSFRRYEHSRSRLKIGAIEKINALAESWGIAL